jgi:hypothetical protein
MLFNEEKVELLARLYSRHMGLVNHSNIDHDDLNVYINHALENGLVNKAELNKLNKELIRS